MRKGVTTRPLGQDVIAALSEFSTPAICNAIERFRARMRNEGYLGSEVPCRVVASKVMVGRAFTLRMRTANAPVKGLFYQDQSDWWDLLSSAPDPKVVVIEDADTPVGVGSVAGDVHAAIFKKFGAVGVVTNGSVRDIAALRAMDIWAYAPSLNPSHAYAHIVDVGQPVTIAGKRIANGDILHGDENGIVSIPPELAEWIPEVARELIARERELFGLLHETNTSVTELRALIATFEIADLKND